MHPEMMQLRGHPLPRTPAAILMSLAVPSPLLPGPGATGTGAYDPDKPLPGAPAYTIRGRPQQPEPDATPGKRTCANCACGNGSLPLTHPSFLVPTAWLAVATFDFAGFQAAICLSTCLLQTQPPRGTGHMPSLHACMLVPLPAPDGRRRRPGLVWRPCHCDGAGGPRLDHGRPARPRRRI